MAIERAVWVSIARVTSEGGDPGNTFGEDGRIFGKIQNPKLPEIRLPHNEARGPIGVEQYWNRNVEFETDFTFDVLDVTEHPEALGPSELFFDVFISYTNGKTQKHRVRGRIKIAGTFAYDQSTDNPRTITVGPTLRVDGGGDNLDDIALPAHDDAAGPELYLDTSDGEYLTKAVGANVVDHYHDIKVAHGVTT